jgi:hypothetical protein
MAEEGLHAREFTSEDARSAAIAVWDVRYDYHRPVSRCRGKPPAARLRESVANVEPPYTYWSARGLALVAWRAAL